MTTSGRDASGTTSMFHVNGESAMTPFMDVAPTSSVSFRKDVRVGGALHVGGSTVSSGPTSLSVSVAGTKPLTVDASGVVVSGDLTVTGKLLTSAPPAAPQAAPQAAVCVQLSSCYQDVEVGAVAPATVEAGGAADGTAFSGSAFVEPANDHAGGNKGCSRGFLGVRVSRPANPPGADASVTLRVCARAFASEPWKDVTGEFQVRVKGDSYALATTPVFSLPSGRPGASLGVRVVSASPPGGARLGGVSLTATA